MNYILLRDLDNSIQFSLNDELELSSFITAPDIFINYSRDNGFEIASSKSYILNEQQKVKLLLCYL
jgi:hypothetical protein